VASVGANHLESLLRSVAAGDRQAFRELYRLTAGKLFATARAIVQDRARAEEVLQDAYCRVWERAGSFDPAKGSAITWLATITRRLAIDDVRRRRIELLSLDDETTGVLDIAADIPEIDPIGMGRLKTCLETLRTDYRHVVVLAHVHGLTYEELARRFDKPVGTMKTWVFRGLAELKACIG
jgi:RNA polymerase sigma-70 factor (ECF subfamily)